jgi:predicted PurR-regulated permease PerM
VPLPDSALHIRARVLAFTRMPAGLRTLSFARLATLAIGIVIAAWFLPAVLQVLLVVFAGALFGNFLAQISSLFARLTAWPYGIAYGVVVLSQFLICGVTVFYMGTRIASQVGILVEQLSRATSNIDSRIGKAAWYQQIGSIVPESQPGLASKAISTVTSAAWSIFTIMAGIVAIIFLGVYFGLQPGEYREGFLKLFRPNARERIDDILNRFAIRLWRWTLGRLFGMAVVGILSGIGLWILGVPLPFTLGVLAGVLDFVPNVGPIIAAIPAILLAYQHGADTAVYVLVLYVVLQFFESYFLTPAIDQHQVSIPPGLVIAAQLIASVVAGFLGLLLATPLTIVGIILVRELTVDNRDGS